MSIPMRALPSDRAALKALWIEAFGDDEKEIEAFFCRFFSQKTALVMRENDRVISMLFLLPVTVVVSQETRLVGYIYGGATCKSERGKGHYRRLLAYAKEVAKEQEMAALFLHPADDRLEDSYCRMGFTVPLYAQETAAPQQVLQLDPKVLSAQEYVRFRRRLLKERNMAYVDWNEEILTHCLSWSRAFAFGQSACALIGDDGSSVYEYISADADAVCYVPTGMTCMPDVWRMIGTCTVVGRLLALNDATWETLVYMGYGME